MPFAFPSTANKEVFSFFSGFLEEESMEQGFSGFFGGRDEGPCPQPFS
jgi:hypothetical protein